MGKKQTNFGVIFAAGFHCFYSRYAIAHFLTKEGSNYHSSCRMAYCLWLKGKFIKRDRGDK